MIYTNWQLVEKRKKLHAKRKNVNQNMQAPHVGVEDEFQ